MKEIIDAIRNQDLISYLYSHQLSGMEAIDVVGEILYVATCRLSEEDREAFYTEIADNLTENFIEEEGDK